MQLIVTNAALAKIAAARGGGAEVNVTQFRIGFTSGTVGADSTSVPGLLYGPVNVSSVQLVDANSVQFECVVPESVGTFTFNVLGLYDSDGDLFCIGRSETTYSKVANNLPTVLGNRVVLKAQVSITNVDGVLSFNLNELSTQNINSVNTVDQLSSLASAGIYKTYRVLTMPDGYADIANTNGSLWSFGRYQQLFIGTCSATAADLTHVVGDNSRPFHSYHVGAVLEFITGANQNHVRRISAVDTTTNIATITPALPNIPQSGNSYNFLILPRKNSVDRFVYPDEAGFLVNDTSLYNDAANQRVGIRISNPAYALDMRGGGIRLREIASAAAPTVTVQGTPGSTTYNYFIVALNWEGKRALPSNAGTTNIGNPTLNGSNFNRISWSAVAGAKEYQVFRSDTSSLIGTVDTNTFDDTGQSIVTTTPPTRNETADVIIDGKMTVGEDPSGNLDLATKQYVDTLVASLTPTGTMRMWPAASVPTGWLLCDGTAVSRTTYANLFALVGTVYGAGNGTTTFNLPDFRGRSPIGPGISDGPNAATTLTLGQKAGEERHILTVAELATHNHTVTTTVSGSGIQGAPSSLGVGTGTTSSTGSSSPHNTLHPVTAVNILIKT